MRRLKAEQREAALREKAERKLQREAEAAAAAAEREREKEEERQRKMALEIQAAEIAAFEKELEAEAREEARVARAKAAQARGRRHSMTASSLPLLVAHQSSDWGAMQSALATPAGMLLGPRHNGVSTSPLLAQKQLRGDASRR